jgi:O-antigen ligase
MSLRVLFCLFLVLGFSWYAYRNWFVSLCAAIFLMAFLKHPDMPRGVAGIPGANLWNILIINVVIAWWHQRPYEAAGAATPQSMKVAVFLYFSVVTISFLRAEIDPTGYYRGTRVDLFIDFFINSIRFLIPAYLFFDGCRTRERVVWGLASISLLYFLLAVQVIRYMGLNLNFSGDELNGRAAKIIQNSVGYNRVDMSMMLAGGSWVAIAFANVLKKKWQQLVLAGAGGVVVFGQALTGGRTGYVTWGAVGLLLCTLRWRKLLPLIPLAVAVVFTALPGVATRMLSGFGSQSDGIVVHQNTDEITSGRNRVWPVVIAKIQESPIFGYGRQAMIRTGLRDWARDVLEDQFDHPHEAYLEMLLDNGVVGFLCIVPIFFIVLKRSAGLFLDRSDVLYGAAGGAALALVLALLIAGFGAQTLYPREGVVGMWAAIGIALRVSLERQRMRSGEGADLAEESEEIEEAEVVQEPSFGGSTNMALGEA